MKYRLKEGQKHYVGSIGSTLRRATAGEIFEESAIPAGARDKFEPVEEAEVSKTSEPEMSKTLESEAAETGSVLKSVLGVFGGDQ
jgi:hypothetical protein